MRLCRKFQSNSCLPWVFYYLLCCTVGEKRVFSREKIGVSPKWYHTGGPAPLHTYVPRGGVKLDFVDRLHTLCTSGYLAPPLPFLYILSRLACCQLSLRAVTPRRFYFLYLKEISNSILQFCHLHPHPPTPFLFNCLR